MAKIKVSELPPLARTLLIPLAYRAIESQRPDPLLQDERAVALSSQFDEDFRKWAKPNGMDQIATMMRARQLDRYVQAFLSRHPDGIVVDIGCGLDTRPDRIDNGQNLWYGLDLPEVIALRRSLLPEGPRQRLAARSVLDFGWMEEIAAQRGAVIFIAEGVFPYFEEDDVRRIILALKDRFPGAELAFDALSPFSIRIHKLNPAIRKASVHLHWGLMDGKTLEAWAPGIHLLEEWKYFDQNEPRLGAYNLMRYIPPLAKANFILHYRLG
jgi:O-methyltransferase involved in polyketide biosynthesis